MPGKAYATVLDQYTLVTVQGRLDSHSMELPSLQQPMAELQIDLSVLTLINSVGIRQFQGWVKSLNCPSIKLSFCTPIFVHQLNLVYQFLPGCQVESFFVPYYSETTKEEQMVLYRKNIEFEKKEEDIVINRPILLDSTGMQMDLDVQSDGYFKFLKEYY